MRSNIYVIFLSSSFAAWVVACGGATIPVDVTTDPPPSVAAPDDDVSVPFAGDAASDASERPSLCFLPPEPGMCKGYAERWAYDPATNRCKTFVYGLCEGNANNFETEEACRNACNAAPPPRNPPPICLLPSESGTCLAHFSRWTYDSALKRCTPFVYGGCGGNANNFETKEKCEEACDL